MSERTIRGSRWWLAILAFLAGIAVHAAATGHRPQALLAEPRAAVTTPAADGAVGVAAADADSDTCGVQQD
jgi:hypothetical protein